MYYYQQDLNLYKNPKEIHKRAYMGSSLYMS